MPSKQITCHSFLNQVSEAAFCRDIKPAELLQGVFACRLSMVLAIYDLGNHGLDPWMK
jgi:hypothetical protein